MRADKVAVAPDLPSEIVDLWEDLKAGRVTDFEAAQTLGRLRVKYASSLTQ